MPFQTVVNRNFTTGFVGEVLRDGPTRAKVVRIVPVTGVNANSARNDGNLIGRVYGYAGEGPVPATGSTVAALSQNVSLGGSLYAGVAIHPKHHVLQGTAAGGPLAPTLALPNGAEVECADMTIIAAQVYNYTTGAVTANPGDALGYVTDAVTDANEALGLPLGAIVTFPQGTVPPVGIAVVPGGIIANPISLGASAAGALVSGVTIIQLTH